MNLFIRTLTGETLTVDVEPNATIQNVKEAIVPLQNIKSTDAMRLTFAGRRLDDERTVSDYNIQKESTLNMVNVSR